ncbi:MAG TPA: DNA alkylation repair protein [Flavitalea sp.]|nr:DNA alkylation repair protein [Flavitalea sp.]
MSSELKAIQTDLKKLSNPDTVGFIKKIAPGAEKVYGVKMPAINELVKKYRSHGFELIKELWKSGAFEERILAAKILEKTAKTDPALALKLVKEFSADISNWAVCDAIGMQSLRSLVKTHTQEIFDLANTLGKSSDPWKIRLSLVLVEWYTREPSQHKAIHYLLRNAEKQDHYYVKKAIDWLKRNLQKKK